MPQPTIIITGVPELDRALREFEPKLQRKVVRQAVRKAAKPVLATAKAKVPVKSGELKRSLKIRAMKASKRGASGSVIGVQVVTGMEFFKGDQFYGAFVEFGHRIGKRSREIAGLHKWRVKLRDQGKELHAALATETIEKVDGRSKIEAKPFLRPAHDENRQVVLEIFQRELAAGVEAVGKGK